MNPKTTTLGVEMMHDIDVSMSIFFRVSNPPGGRSSDIFNDDRNVVTPSPRKVKDYMKSHVFNGDSSDSTASVKVSKCHFICESVVYRCKNDLRSILDRLYKIFRVCR